MMKKLLFGIAAIMLVASCSGNKENSENAVDTGLEKDTASLTITEDSVKNQTVVDSTTQDKPLAQEAAKTAKEEKDKAEKDKEEKDNKPSPNAKKIDKLLNTYMLCAKQHADEIRAGNQYDSFLREIDMEAGKIDKQLRKFKGEMTKEQLAKYKKADKMLSKTPI